MNIVGVVLSFLYFFLIIFITRLFPKSDEEYLRKFVHIMIGNWWLILWVFITNTLCAFVVPVAFVFINYYSVTKSHDNGLLSTLERKDLDMVSSSYGLILYPIALVIMVFVSFVLTDKRYLGGVGIVPLAYGDGFAAIIGKRFPIGEYHIGSTKKTFTGSLSMLLISVFLLTLYLTDIVGFAIADVMYKIILAAVFAMITEAITPNGFDNLTVPIISVLPFLMS